MYYQKHMKGRSVHLEFIEKSSKLHTYLVVASINLAASTDDCSECYAIPRAYKQGRGNAPRIYDMTRQNSKMAGRIIC